MSGIALDGDCRFLYRGGVFALLSPPGTEICERDVIKTARFAFMLSVWYACSVEISGSLTVWRLVAVLSVLRGSLGTFGSGGSVSKSITPGKVEVALCARIVALFSFPFCTVATPGFEIVV